tara:strand:+ start:253 stop:1380 length:1128 start_codon:yes stop_codon:yes gene_type:complete
MSGLPPPPKGLTWSSAKRSVNVAKQVPVVPETDVSGSAEVVSVGAPKTPIEVEPSPPPPPPPPPPVQEPEPVETATESTDAAPYLPPPVYSSVGVLGGRKTFGFLPSILSPSQSLPGVKSTEQHQKDLERQRLTTTPEERLALKRQEYLRSRGATKASKLRVEPTDRSDLETYALASRLGLPNNYPTFEIDSESGMPVMRLNPSGKVTPDNPEGLLELDRGQFFAGSYRTKEGENFPLTPNLIRVGIAKIDRSISPLKQKIFDIEDELGDAQRVIDEMDEIKNIPPMIVGLRFTEYKNEKPFTPQQKKLVQKYIREHDQGGRYYDTVSFDQDYNDMLDRIEQLKAEKAAFTEARTPREAAKARLEYQLHTLLNQK